MSSLNKVQEQISETLQGMIVVDAGPGTGKTHTIVQRYCNILADPDVDPRDILLLTFTNNAAEEMRERLENKVGSKTQIQATTFDAFCLDLVMDSAESVSNALGFEETLTRGASLIESKSLNLEHFHKIYSKFMKKDGFRRYGNLTAISGIHVNGLFDLIEKLMSRGLVPLPGYDWLGDESILEGSKNELLERLREKNSADLLKRSVKNLEDDLPEWYSDSLDEVPDDILKDAVDEDRRDLIWMIHDIYREYLRSSISDNRLTFAIVELFALSALYSDVNVRKRFSYRYVMIDEFQDTNGLQMRIAMLILREPNLCAVGDWKQGIYGFRNVSIENIINFDERVNEARTDLNRNGKRIDFKIGETKRFELEENYRSSQAIIDAAFRALTLKAAEKEEMEDLSSKIVKIRAARSDIGGNTGVESICASSSEEEIHMIAEKVHDYVSSGKYIICEDGTERRPRYGDIAVLCRKNSMGRDIRDKMIELGIPAFLQGDANIMSSREAKLALAWLRYVNNGNDPRGPVAIMADLGYSMAEIETSVKRTKEGMNIPKNIKDTRRGLLPKRRRITSLLTSIFSIYGLNNDITQSMISVISAAHRGSLLTVSDVIGLIEKDMERSETYELDPSLEKEAVTVQTMHKSKGLEYPIVIVAGMNHRMFPRHENPQKGFVADDLFGIRMTDEYVESNLYHRIRPSWRWKLISGAKDTDYNEQRRLLFVAISRAKQYVTFTAHRPSLFMKGYGEILSVEPTMTKIVVTKGTAGTTRPAIGEYRTVREELSVHDLMGEHLDSGGKGVDHGNKVHDAAHLLATGRVPKDDLEEVPEIQRILDSVKDSDVLTEVDCIIPIGGKVVRGIIDMIAVYPDRVEIHDYKTDADDSNFERYRIQLSAYSIAATSQFNRPVECFIDYVSQKRSIRIDIIPYDEMERLVKTHI